MPVRFADVVASFANANPAATVGDWAEFAREHAREAYRAGYVRGYEYVERDPEGYRQDLPPEVLADMLDPDWRASEPVVLHYPDAPVRYSYPEDDLLRWHIGAMNSQVEDPVYKRARRS